MIRKITKKKVVGSKFKKSKQSKKSNILFCQHNIGPVPSKFKNIIYDSSGYKNIVKQKRFFPPKDIIRNFQNYIKINKLSKYDIFTLQEIQLGQKDINELVDDKYYVNYKSTGYLNFCFVEKGKEIREVKKNVQKIFHGSAAVINTNKFNIIGVYNIRFEKLRNRTSDFIIIQNKINQNKYGILSLHGLIPKNFSDNKLKVYQNFYNHIFKVLKTIKNKNKDIKFILGGDFNTNILNPVIDEESENNLPDYKRKNIDLFKKLLKKFKNDLGKIGIDILSDGKITNFNIENNYKEELDFILISKNLISKKNKIEKNKIKYYKGNIKNLSEYKELKNDFDHCMLGLEIN